MAVASKNYDCFSMESPWVKALAAVPTLGVVPTFLAMPVIDSKLQSAVRSMNENRIIEVLEHKKDYLFANAISGMLGVVLTIVGLAIGIFVPMEALALGLIYTGYTAIFGVRYLDMQTKIEEIQTTGLRQGMLL